MNMVSGPESSVPDIPTGLRTLLRGPALYEPRTAWGPFTALLIVTVAYTAPVALLFAAVAVATHFGVSAVDINRAAAAVSSLSSPWGATAAGLSQILAIAVIWLAAGRGGLRSSTLRLGNPRPTWVAAIGAGIILIVVTSSLELALYTLSGTDPFADGKWIADGLRTPTWWLIVVMAVVLAPVWEELAFRGFLLSALAQTRLGFWPSALVTTSIWTTLHGTYSYAGLASVFVAGLCLSWLMLRYGSIKITIVAHALANVVALTVAMLFAPVG